MAYVTWTEFADALQGEDRVKRMHPKLKTETADAHPFFSSQLAIAARRADVELEQAGYEIPLASISDPLLKNAIIGLLVSVITETSSSREPFADSLASSADAYFKRLGKGTITVLGATEDDTPQMGALMIGSAMDTPVFDVGGEAEHVFARFGPFGDRWGRS